MNTASDETRKMRHVDHQPGADLVSDLAKPPKSMMPRIGGAAGDNDAGAMHLRQCEHLIHIDAVIVATTL